MTIADNYFMANLAKIMNDGYSDINDEVRPKWEDGTPAHTKKIFGQMDEYDLTYEFPILTVRKVPIKSAVEEILWIFQKKSNNVHDLKSHIWDAWANEYGSIGKAYGYQMGVKYDWGDNNGGVLDQTDKLIWDLTHNKGSRRIMTTVWNPHDIKEMGLAPCAYSTIWITEGPYLNMMLLQRSQDMMVANGWNTVQYAALQCMIAHVTGFIPKTFKHVIADCHIYDRHEEFAKKIINTIPKVRRAPQLLLRKNVKNFYDFTLDDIKLGNSLGETEFAGYPANPVEHETVPYKYEYDKENDFKLPVAV